MSTTDQPYSEASRTSRSEDQSYSEASRTRYSDITSPVLTNSLQDPKAFSVWNLPGLDKETFYAAALYLHTAAKGQLRDPSERSIRYETKTDEDTQNFLDRLADCFARSKTEDPSAHVTATAMVIEDQLRKITIYISKNHSEKGLVLPSDNHDAQHAENQNKAFASTLFSWFNSLARGENSEALDGDNSWSSSNDVLTTMYTFSQSRIRYYIHKIMDIQGSMDNQPPDEAVQDVIAKCRSYQEMPGLEALGECVRSAAACRSNVSLQKFNLSADMAFGDDGIDKATKNLARLTKWVNYLGRLGGAYGTFYKFCTTTKRRGYHYRYELLQSPEEQSWPTNTYKSKIESWTIGGLNLEDEQRGQTTVGAILNEFPAKAGKRCTARVHCEIQLLDYFTQQGAEQCLDYFGCSKKSCWLCWKLIGHHGKYTTKESHRMIYPMWAFPSNVSLSRLTMVRALQATYNDMLFLIQEKVLNATGAAKMPDPRIIDMPFFEMDESDIVELVMDSNFENDFEMAFASELHTKPPRRELTRAECERSFWHSAGFFSSNNRIMDYKLVYRVGPTDEEDGELPVNPWLFEQLKRMYPEIKQREIPWRGDVFIFPVRNTSPEVVPSPLWP
ncbi:hypothetical protein G7Y89_g9331 [Cudoniella acicularis]|uniref:Uncharacterized protein n=1 Tax=Cudoniella acicularis TaxID=354080 RepID=A0A8H4RHI3_9HELO|nr:hypothetical protein G7Y89_g9331 [Cudoniella acicularis]